MRTLRTEADPLGSEAYTSQLLSALMIRDDPDSDETIVLGFIETIGGRGGPECLAVARALSTVATTARTRRAAAEVADRIAACGTPEPLWRNELGQSRLVGCHEYADVFGDERVLMAAFSGRIRHALIGFLNLSHPDGFLTDIVLTTAIDKAIAGFGRRAMDLDGLARFGPADEAEVVDTLATALAESHRCVDVPDDVVGLRPLLGARLAGCAKGSTRVVHDDGWATLFAGLVRPDDGHREGGGAPRMARLQCRVRCRAGSSRQSDQDPGFRPSSGRGAGSGGTGGHEPGPRPRPGEPALTART